LISIYGFAVFGYITASLASFFIDQEARSRESEVAGSSEIAALRRDLALLRGEPHSAPK
jgi:voltage-gated potassium channel